MFNKKPNKLLNDLNKFLVLPNVLGKILSLRFIEIVRKIFLDNLSNILHSFIKYFLKLEICFGFNCFHSNFSN